MEIDRVGATNFQRLAAHLDAPAEYPNGAVTDMPPRIGRVGNDGISTSQPSQGNGSIGGIATYRPYIRLHRIEKFEYLFRSHALDLVYIARPLVIAIRFISLIGVPFSVATHKVGGLHTPYSLAGSIFAGNQVDGLRLPPGILLRYNVLDVADIYCHMSFSLCDLSAGC